MNRFVFAILLCILFVLTPITCADSLHLTMVDVGAAECIIIESDEEAMIVDAGYAKAWDDISDAVEQMGIQSLKYFVITHPHADHIGSATRIINQYTPEIALMPPIEYDTKAFDNVLASLSELDIAVEYPDVGDVYRFGQACVTIYGPHPVAYENPNDWSIVMMIEYAGRRILLTGDIEAEAEGDLLAYDDIYPLDADILKVAHHGSDSSTIYSFAQAVSPEYALVSCASDEDRSYPHVETAMTLYDCGVSDIYTTEVCGDISVTVDSDGSFSIETQH